MPESLYHPENTAARELLRGFIQRASDADFRQPMPAGWTVSGVLAHLAFWELRALTLLRKWQVEGISPSAVDIDVINETARRLCLAMEPSAAAELLQQSAAELDALIEQLDPDFIAQVETHGKTVRLNRASHRRAHLDEIHRALGWPPVEG